MAQNSNVPRSQEDYINQVSEEIEGRVTKKLSQEFSKTENRILCALSRVDDLLMDPLIQGYSGTVQERTRNAFGTNRERMRTTLRAIFQKLIAGTKSKCCSPVLWIEKTRAIEFFQQVYICLRLMIILHVFVYVEVEILAKKLKGCHMEDKKSLTHNFQA